MIGMEIGVIYFYLLLSLLSFFFCFVISDIVNAATQQQTNEIYQQKECGAQKPRNHKNTKLSVSFFIEEIYILLRI